MKEDSTGSLSDIAAEKIAHDYVPPIAKVKAWEGDQIIDAVIDANWRTTATFDRL